MQPIIESIFEEVKNLQRSIQNLRFFTFSDIPKFFRVFSKNENIILAVCAVILLTNFSIYTTRGYLHHTVIVAGSGGDYSEAFVGAPHYLNPLLAESQTDQDLTKLVYTGLYSTDEHGNLIPNLASGPVQISSDQKQFTIPLKTTIKWQDGQNFSADDVVFTIQTLQNSAYNSPLYPLWQNITISKIDDHTIKLTNTNISAPFLSNLTLGILPQHIWSQVSPENFASSQYNLQPVGTGPYYIKEISKSTEGEISTITFDSYANYWAGKPLIDTITAKFFNQYEDALFSLHAKEVQGFGFIPFDKKIYVDQAKTNLHIYKLPVYEYQGLFFNEAKSPKVLSDPVVRQALAMSVDRNSLIQDVYNGFATPLFGPIMPGQIGYDPSIQSINSYSISAANTLLDQDGWVLDPNTHIRSKKNTQLSFTITTNDFVLNDDSAQNLKNQWQKIGVNVNVTIVPTAQLEQNYIKTRNYDSILFAESTGSDPDPFAFWHSSQAQGDGFNLSSYKNPQVDALISNARNTFDSSVRTTDYQQFQHIIAVDIPAIILDQTMYVYELTPSLQGVHLTTLANPEDRFYDVNQWYLNTKRVWK